MWVLVVVLLVALMIPITAILLDSPLGRSFARRLEGQGDGGGAGSGAGVRKLEQRVEALETDLEDLNRSLAGMREELQFVTHAGDGAIQVLEIGFQRFHPLLQLAHAGATPRPPSVALTLQPPRKRAPQR